MLLLSNVLKVIRFESDSDLNSHKRRRENGFCIGISACMIFSVLAGLGGQGLLLAYLLIPVFLFVVGGLKRGGITDLLLMVFLLVIFRFRYFCVPYIRESSCLNPFWYPLWFLLFSAAAFGIVFHYKKEILREKNQDQANRKMMENNYKRFASLSRQTIRSISNAVDARDRDTRMHSSRVSDYAVMIAQALGWSEERTEELRDIALLHDIGKIGISDSILNKKGSLTPEETEIIRQHTVIGGEILKDLTMIPSASMGALMHHEWYNGEGYPYRLKGDQIPVEARIIGIADAFDAMNSSRLYRGKISAEKIMQELRSGSGTQFDPELMDVFLPIAQNLLFKNP